MGALDPAIHAETRLRIMSALDTLGQGDKLSFNALRKALDLTVGNLSVHLTKLEAAGYIAIDKTFEGRKPATYVAMTAKGRAAFEQYIHELKRLLGEKP
ncbi:MAG: transcriptional regulator [Bifidobacteriaceae bacterium]|jgi:DNA-binding MarR family transcriptional regulator|nr:transcriptional regulator [Bifidobacteriaceae bacterium]